MNIFALENAVLTANILKPRTEDVLRDYLDLSYSLKITAKRSMSKTNKFTKPPAES